MSIVIKYFSLKWKFICFQKANDKITYFSIGVLYAKPNIQIIKNNRHPINNVASFESNNCIFLRIVRFNLTSKPHSQPGFFTSESNNINIYPAVKNCPPNQYIQITQKYMSDIHVSIKIIATKIFAVNEVK